MFGDIQSTDNGMDLLGLQFKDEMFEDMVTDAHTDERMMKKMQQEKRTKKKRKGLFSFFCKKK